MNLISKRHAPGYISKKNESFSYPPFLEPVAMTQRTSSRAKKLDWGVRSLVDHLSYGISFPKLLMRGDNEPSAIYLAIETQQRAFIRSLQTHHQ